MDEIKKYDVIILSDVGSDTLLLHPDVLEKSKKRVKRLKLIHDFVEQGGGLLMVGGWMSFSGIEGKAKFYGSIIEKCLPIDCLVYDDRQECPEGIYPRKAGTGNDLIMKDMPQ